MSEIFRDEFYVVVADKEFLRLERTALPYPTMAAMHESNLGLAGALRKARLRRVLSICARGRPGATTRSSRPRARRGAFSWPRSASA